MGDCTFLRMMFQKLGSLILSWLSALSLTNLLLEKEQDPLTSEYLAILELFWMMSSTLRSKKVSFSPYSLF